VSLRCWVAVIVVEIRSRMASKSGGGADEEGDAGSPCEVKDFTVGFKVSLQSSLDGYVCCAVAVPSASLKTSYALVGLCVLEGAGALLTISSASPETAL